MVSLLTLILQLSLVINILAGSGSLRRPLFKGSRLFIPCLAQDAVFVNGLCVLCNRPLEYPDSDNCTSFYTERQFISNSFNGPRGKDGKKTLNPSILLVGDHHSKCKPGIGCLRSQTDIGKAKILTGQSYLNGRTLRVVTIERLPFVKIVDGQYTGVCYELIQALQIKYNFSTDIFLPYDGNWGAKTKNGTWNGMVGQVLRKEADIGVAGFSVTLERSKAIAFTASFHQEPTGILIPPPTEGEKLSVLIRPLSPEVWLSVFLTIVILAPTLYAMHVTSLRITEGKGVKVKGFFSLTGDLLHFMIGSLVQESVISPVNKTTRFLVILWWLLTFIVANIYVGYLVSYLSAPKLYNTVNSLEDLIQQKEIKWTFRLNTAHQSLFKSETSTGVYKLVGDGVVESELVRSDWEGVQKVLDGKHAFIKESSYLDVGLANDFLASRTCRMTLAKETFFRVETALIVQKKSPFLDLLNSEISVTVSTGLMEKWKMIHWPREVWCVDAASYLSSTRPKTRKLRLDDVQGAYFILFCGVMSSLLAFISEQIFQFLCIRFPNAMSSSYLK